MSIILMVNIIGPFVIAALYYFFWRKSEKYLFELRFFSVLALVVIALWWWDNLAAMLQFPYQVVLSSVLIEKVVAGLFLAIIASFLAKKLYVNKLQQKNINHKKNLAVLSNDELVQTFIDAARNCAFFVKSKEAMEKKEALESYQVVLDVREEVLSRDSSGNLLIPLLHDEDDAVRVCAAACMGGLAGDRFITIIRDVAERPEVNPSNVVFLARFFLDSINATIQAAQQENE
jgi:hypothetical protein